MSYTFVTMSVGAAVFEEIKGKLLAAGYDHAVVPPRMGREEILDMHGIGLQIEPSRPVEAGTLEVGHNLHGEVVVNHPDLKPDANGVGHIVFSPEQARNFAALLLAHASDTERSRA